MVYRNKKLCVRCNKYLPCKITDNICCDCQGLPYQACSVCKWEVEHGSGKRSLIDQTKLQELNYWSYKGRLRQDPLHYQGHSRFSCSKCGKELEQAGHHGEVKQRYQTKFWELKTPYKVLCFDCLDQFKTKMPTPKKYTFNKYLRRYVNN